MLYLLRKTGLKYSSTTKTLNEDNTEVSVMHACGHDMHMAVAVGTAKELIKRKSEWSGTLMIIFQPAEEVGQGSAKMLKEGLFEKFPRPDFHPGSHVGSLLAGKVTYTKGYAMANVDMADITISWNRRSWCLPPSSKRSYCSCLKNCSSTPNNRK